MQRSTMPDNKVACQILSSADAISSLMDQHGISDSNDEVDVSELLNRLERVDGMAKGENQWDHRTLSRPALSPPKSSKPRSHVRLTTTTLPSHELTVFRSQSNSLLCRMLPCFRYCIVSSADTVIYVSS